PARRQAQHRRRPPGGTSGTATTAVLPHAAQSGHARTRPPTPLVRDPHRPAVQQLGQQLPVGRAGRPVRIRRHLGRSRDAQTRSGHLPARPAAAGNPAAANGLRRRRSPQHRSGPTPGNARDPAHRQRHHPPATGPAHPPADEHRPRTSRSAASKGVWMNASGELPGLDLEKLRDYLAREQPGLISGPLSGELIQGGRSNLTYRVTDGTKQLVVRRPPLGHVLATAHDMGREFRVMSALSGTPVPVPETIALCSDETVLGAPFYVMEHVPGTVYRTPELTGELSIDQRRQLSWQLIDVLAELHGTDPQQVGLADFGRPEGFLQRQIRRWSKQLAASRSRDIPGIEELAAELAERIPQTRRAAIVHGDYRLDNVLVGEDQNISAVLHW